MSFVGCLGGFQFFNIFSNFLSKLTRKKIQVVMLGIWSCGKTTLMYKMVGQGGLPTIPTIGFNVESVDYGESHNLEFWDIGGGSAIPPLWKHYIVPSDTLNTNCIIFLIDSQNTNRQYIQESFRHLDEYILQVPNAENIKLLILLSKYDFDSPEGTVNQLEITDILNECNVIDPSRDWVIKKCNAFNGKGVEEILDWLVENC